MVPAGPKPKRTITAALHRTKAPAPKPDEVVAEAGEDEKASESTLAAMEEATKRGGQ